MRKRITILLFLFSIYTVIFCMKTYSLDLKTYSQTHFNRLCEITGFDFKNQMIKIFEYDNLAEFRKESGGSFFIKGFTNSRGTFLQSRTLLKADFNDTLIHEMIHALIKSQYPVPLWFEEGLVCIITDEFSDISGIPAMTDIENFKTNQADSNWEILSYCLGCVARVKEILDID